MSKIEDIVKDYDYESLSEDRRISESEIPVYEDALGVKFGEQLKEYILKYGYLAYEHIEFNGVNANEKLDSDMIKNTKNIRNISDKIKDFIVVENQGDGDYYLIDSNDNMYEFILDGSSELKKIDMDFSQYINNRFASVKK